MDKNSLIGLLMIGAILIGWMYFMSPSQEELEQQKRQQDSLALVMQQKQQQVQAQSISAEKETTTALDTTAMLSDSAKAEIKQSIYGAFAGAAEGENKTITIENELIKVSLNTLGGKIASVQLKKYKTYDGKPLMLFDADSSIFAVAFSAYSRFFSTDSLYFTSENTSFTVDGESNKSIALRLYAGARNKYIEYKYTLSGNSYLVNFKINIVGLQDIIAANSSDLTLQWRMNLPSQEKSIDNERSASTIYYKYLEDEVDQINPTNYEKKSLEAKVKWIAFKQQFFTSALIAENAFEKPTDIQNIEDATSKQYVKTLTANLTIPYNHQASESFPMKFYFGPNHYQTLKKYDIQLEKQIDLGWGIFGWVNRFLVIPIFNFLNSFNLNYGIIILILTLIIKILLLPIAYKTHMSSAKMKVLKPEIDEINKKYEGGDAMKKQQATMTLYKTAGVNPLAGCIPVLLQMPILFALFRFFPSSIELRQSGFLWAEDLSTYDSVLQLPFHIPGYGDHVSLFALLMTISTIIYTHTNSQLMGGDNAQMKSMKWLMYLMPIMFLGFLNNYSAGLSYYYFLANMITFAQTFIMRKFINEEELHRKIKAHMKKPVKVSKFQQRLEEMAKQKQAQMGKKK